MGQLHVHVYIRFVHRLALCSSLILLDKCYNNKAILHTKLILVLYMHGIRKLGI